MKNVGDAGFSRKRGGNAGSGPSLPDPALIESFRNQLQKKLPTYDKLSDME